MKKIDGWRIKSIYMNGLLMKQNIHWDLDPYINILGGKNGSGKSTLLHGLTIPFNEVTTDNLEVHCHALFDSIEIKLFSGVQYSLKRNIKINTKTIDSLPDQILGKSIIKFHENVEFIRDVTITEKSEQHFIRPNALYINTSEIAYRTIEKFVEGSQQIKRPGSTMLDILIEKALNKRNELFSQYVYKAMSEENKDELNRLYDYFGRFDKVVTMFMSDYILRNPSSLCFIISGEKEEEIYFPNLSTGEKQILYLLLTVTNTLEEPTILFLDEPDLGMHIDWKKMLLRSLLEINPNMQIIAATHSPSLIDNMYNNVKEISQLIAN